MATGQLRNCKRRTTREDEERFIPQKARDGAAVLGGRKERFLSAQADPSQEVKGKKKSACSVRNDGQMLSRDWTLAGRR